MTKDDVYPHFICESCLKRLTDAYVFKETCYKSSEKLAQLYHNHSAHFCETFGTNVASAVSSPLPSDTNNLETFYILKEHLKSNEYSKDELVQQNDLSGHSIEYTTENLFGNCSQLLSSNFIPTYNNGNTYENRSDIDQERSCANEARSINHNSNAKKSEHLNNFTCQECKKVFHSKSGMRKHMKIHTESEKLKCTVCAKQFTRYDSSNLRYFLNYDSPN